MRKSFVLLAVVLATAAAPAAAADLKKRAVPEAVPDLPPVEPLPQDDAGIGSGFYVRIDGGYAFANGPDASSGGRAMKGVNLDGSGFAGGGVGMRFNEWLRADVTADYRFPASFRGNLACPAGCGAGAVTFRDRGKIDATTTLVNGYVDMPGMGVVTPYVGVGLGASRLETSHYTVRGPGGTTRVGGDSQWNFAYAAMAGVAFAITPNVSLDVGYRFVSLGETETKRTGIAGRNARVAVKDVTASELMVGLRYSFN